jgi:hypothetical protein
VSANEPAFPAVDYISQDGKVNPRGLTKREYFAAKALQGLIATPVVRDNTIDGHARSAVKYADALIAELAKAAP